MYMSKIVSCIAFTFALVAAQPCKRDGHNNTSIDPLKSIDCNNQLIPNPLCDSPGDNDVTAFAGHYQNWDCHCNLPSNLRDVSDLINALDLYGQRGQWGHMKYGTLNVDSRNLLSWNSAWDCINETKDKLLECSDANGGNAYVEQVVFGSKCMMHYWYDGC